MCHPLSVLHPPQLAAPLSILYADDPGKTILERATHGEHPFPFARVHRARQVNGRGLAKRESHASYLLPIVTVSAPLAPVVTIG